MSAYVQRFILFALLPAVLGGWMPACSLPQTPAGAPFVTRVGAQLQLNGAPFRFSGPNIYWLGLDDKADNGVDYPSEERVRDALATAKEMGATVVRSHAAISTGCALCIEPTSGVFNETALRRLDFAIAAAGEAGLRLILPLTDNYRYYHGGKHDFTDWHNLGDEQLFYTNPDVIASFKLYVATILNRVNSYTGIAYKDDPTIMAWETGNELLPPASWTQMIAAYLKSIDSQHLIVDGRYGIDSSALTLASVDIYSDHFYPLSVARLTSGVNLVASAGKVYLAGEYDWANSQGGDALPDFLHALESNPSIGGDTFWALFSHSELFGYASLDRDLDLHYPGGTPDRRLRAQQLRAHAYALRGLPPPDPQAVDAPTITSASSMLTWRGVPGADRYTIERSTEGMNGPWTVICDQCASDFATPWTDAERATISGGFKIALPLITQSAQRASRTAEQRAAVGNSSFSSSAVPIGVWYRIKAHNLAGVAGAYSPAFFSASIGFHDGLEDWSKTASHSANLAFDTTASWYFDGDSSRAYRGVSRTNESITWYALNMRSFEATTYFWPFEAISAFDVLVSGDGTTFQPITPTISMDPTHWFRHTYTLVNLADVNYVQMRWNNTTGQPWSPQIGGVDITQGALNRAQGAGVSASSTLNAAGWSTAAITDGVRISQANAHGWSSDSSLGTQHSEWVMFDLGRAATLNRVDLYPQTDAGMIGAGFPEDFTIQVGDGITWTTVVTQTAYPRPAGVVQSFSFAPHSARYVRIEGTRLRNNGSGEFRMQLAEVEIY